MVLMWEAKVFAAAAADMVDVEDVARVAEINWKHKFTLDQGDLMIMESELLFEEKWLSP